MHYGKTYVSSPQTGVGYNTPHGNSTPFNTESNADFYVCGGETPLEGNDSVVVTASDNMQAHNYGEYKSALKRKYVVDAVRPPPIKNWDKIPEFNEKGGLAIFLGRDESYPDALNALIHPSSCDLCNAKFNAPVAAKDHFESKSHDKHLTAWLNKNYTEKGLEAPEIKRYHRQGPVGPEAFYCEHCDLKLTSLTHADQHYSGKRHKMVISQRAKPAGAGFYNNEGKWVRLSTKANPKSADRRFGIGEQFQAVDNNTVTTTTTSDDATIAPEVTNNPLNTAEQTEVRPPKIPKVDESDSNLFCALCRVSVTSALQMTMHLSGAKHQKKLKASGVELTNTGHAPSSTSADLVSNAAFIRDNVLNSVIKEDKPDPTDLSMYRTPSGQYYCKTCNITITNLNALEQHLKGKRHLKSALEEKALAALSGRNNKGITTK
ncbi:zinc finger protein 346 [Stomoxys calcitrans]|uniref:C2H2-type domain-containing protein n=1 Tax=Stomoxys calcitrans TaxID=35570 RepID=A0A1I8QB18_STOCA|nr:zinc finger protein 346 [Stomoxys calcitrans]